MSQRAGLNANAARYPRQKIRLPHPRSRSGCLVCRRQHKKCDERRPACSRCALKGHACQWPGTARREPERKWTRSLIDDALSIQHSPYGPSHSREETLPLTSTSNEGSGPSGEDPRPSTPLGCSLGPVSSMFLAHFVAETSRFMAIVSPERNPFLTHMLPMAFSDELILHSLLALGGAHLERKQSSPEINMWVCRHYGRVICQLQDIISRKSSEPIEWPRALLALLILYLIGVLSPMQDGGALIHIRAGRKLVPQLLSAPSERSSTRTLCGLTLELYTYLALISSPTPYSNGTQSETDTRNSYLPSWDIIRNYGIFGVIVSPIYRCLDLIPRVVTFCTRRQAEMTFNECSPESWAEFFEITSVIESFGFADDFLESGLPPEEHEQSLSLLAVYRHALAIFTYDAMWCGTLPGDENQLSIVRWHALSALALIPNLMNTHLGSLLLWPIIVIGSCLVNEAEWDIIRSLLSIKERIFVVMRMKTMLEALWAESDPVYFGPYGLHKLMLSHQGVICLA